MGFKFKKGSKVEVRIKREWPLGYWICAEIVSGKGRYYCVRYESYDRYPSDIRASVKRVPRKAIRPCPPVRSWESWVPGNIVEVFDNNSWKLVEVASVVGGNYYIVKLLGSCMESKVHSSDLRLQQYWQDDKWIIEKDLEDCTDEVMIRQSKEGSLSYIMPQPCSEVKKCPGYSHFPTKNDTGFEESSQDLSRGTKRKVHICSPLVETSTEARKLRAVEKDGKGRRLVARGATKLQEKVDAVAFPQAMLGEKYTHASLNSRTAFSEKGTGRKTPNVDNEGYFVPALEHSEAESTFSSVGSCSINSSPYSSAQPINGLPEHLGSDYGSTKASFAPGSEPSLPTKEALTADIHQPELHAYRTTLVALHASGPISWEQEALLTNLRLMLHISTDEHLLELRNLNICWNICSSFR